MQGFERTMGELIDLSYKLERLPSNIITLAPWQFRRASWATSHFIQMSKSQSAKLEQHRKEAHEMGKKGISTLPPHFVLDGGLAYTIRAMYANRTNEKKMRDIYYLTGLMDCMINQVNPVLRTDLLRDMYKKVFSLKNELKVHWFGPLDHVLLPIDKHFYDESEYRSGLVRARTLKALYQTIKDGADEMFDVFSLEYVFYCPSVGG